MYILRRKTANGTKILRFSTTNAVMFIIIIILQHYDALDNQSKEMRRWKHFIIVNFEGYSKK